jgi:hypothetical protein
MKYGQKNVHSKSTSPKSSFGPGTRHFGIVVDGLVSEGRRNFSETMTALAHAAELGRVGASPASLVTDSRDRSKANVTHRLS